MPNDEQARASEEFAAAIRELLEGLAPNRAIDAVDREIDRRCESLRPYLEAANEAQLTAARHATVHAFWPNFNRFDDRERAELECQMRAAEAASTSARDKTDQLAEPHAGAITHLRRLHAIRQSVSPN